MTRHSLPIVLPDDQKVSFVELFFDLVFVYFVCGTAASMWRAIGRPLPWRWALASFVAIVVFA
jgi:low temperature requirement protein LtrA